MNLFSIKSRKHAVGMMLTGALMISFSGVYVKLAHVSSETAGFYRVIFGAIPLFIILLVKREPLWKGWYTCLLGITGGIFFAIDLFAWHKSIHYIGPGLATILGNFQVFFLAGIGIFVLKEKITPRLLLAIPFAIAGLFLVVGVAWENLSSAYKTGIFLGIVTAMCYTGYILSLKKLQSMPKPLSAEANLLIICLSTATIFACLMLFQKNAFVIPDIQSFLSLAAYGFLSQALGWMIISRALPHLQTSVTGLLLLLQPTFAFAWDMIFFSRPTSLLDITGIMLTIFAIYLGSARQK
ncbi:MAG: DMT family transporter [Proteobacteria bacterium]|nr:DMT family transporter [Pseudomonadota bacterium]